MKDEGADQDNECQGHTKTKDAGATNNRTLTEPSFTHRKASSRQQHRNSVGRARVVGQRCLRPHTHHGGQRLAPVWCVRGLM